MAIHYDPKSKRFRDERGFVSNARGMRSSVARRELERATRPRQPKPKTKPKAAPKPKAKPPKAKAPARQAAPSSKPKPAATKTKGKGKRKGKPKPRDKGRVSHAKPPVILEWDEQPTEDEFGDWIPPWEREGIVREYPTEAEWLDRETLDSWDTFADDWGDQIDEDTAS